MKDKVSVANDNLCRIAEIDTINMIIKDENFEIENVKYVSDLDYNLISKDLLEYQEFKISLLHDDWCSYYFIEKPVRLGKAS